MARSLFEDLQTGGVAPKVFEVDDKFVVFVVTERTDANPKEFTDSTRTRIKGDLTAERGFVAVQDWVSKRCMALAEAGRIGLNAAMLQQILGTDSAFRYEVCSTLK